MNAERRIAVYTRDRAALTPHQRRRVVHKARGKERAAALALIAALVVGATSCKGGAGSREARTLLVGTPASRAPTGWNGWKGYAATTTTAAPPPTTAAKTTQHTQAPRASRSASPPGGTLARIRGCESQGDPNAPGNYRAKNKTSTASGGYQVLDSTWDGYAGYEHARDAPPGVQDQWAREAYAKDGTKPWKASRGCWS